jgi:CubicO group peptidase (beta-lactamase class C family)
MTGRRPGPGATEPGPRPGAEPPPVLGDVARALEDGRDAGVAPGLAAAIRARGRLVHLSAAGDAQVEPERRGLGAADLFDVASLTKPLATATLAAILVAEGRLGLDEPVADRLPAFGGGDGGRAADGGGSAPGASAPASGAAGRGRVTVRHLLCHSSGLPGWCPYFERVAADPVGGLAFLPPAERPGDLAPPFARGLELLREAVLSEPLEAEPGARVLYSDPGFLLLGWIVEAAGGAPLDRLFAGRVAGPLGLSGAAFVRGQAAAGPDGAPYVATERCEHRHEVNLGAVNDDNAWALGGVAGHAGLFASAEAIAVLGQAWLDALEGRAGGLLDPRVAAAFARVQGPAGTTRALGWDTPSREGSSLGRRLGRGPRGALGHLGFTGTSLWIDRDAGVVAALLTNRVHPSRENERIREFRPLFHDAVAEALGI